MRHAREDGGGGAREDALTLLEPSPSPAGLASGSLSWCLGEREPDCKSPTGSASLLPKIFIASILSLLVSSGAAIGISVSFHMLGGSADHAHARALGHNAAPRRQYATSSNNPRADQVQKREMELLLETQPSAPEGVGPGTCYEALLEEAKGLAPVNASKVEKWMHAGPYFAVTGGLGAHEFPKMMGKVREKTIWSFWYDAEHCRSAARCIMPAVAQLCSETVRKHQGGFDYKLLHFDEVLDYVSPMELPLHWKKLQPVQMKDAIMNALLARYGGIAMDVTTILFRTLDAYWLQMVESQATFRGYMYRASGRPWGLPQVIAPWFMMSRREGLLSTAARAQAVYLCDAHRAPSFTLGDHTLTPVLHMFNYSLPRCDMDPLVTNKWACPELDQPRWYDAMPGPARNDRLLMLRDPREGPQLDFALLDDFSMGTWHTWNSTPFAPEAWATLRGTQSLEPPTEPCPSMSACWHSFMRRYRKFAPLGFIKLFRGGGRLRHVGLKEILKDEDTFFYQWLKLAGLNSSQLEPPKLGL
jgi:hypothetical protein